MTLYHYIGANKPLPLGHYGELYTMKRLGDIPKPKNKRDLRNLFDLSDLENEMVKVYETELDFAYVAISEVRAEEIIKQLPMSKEYIYELGGHFDLNGEDYFKNRIAYQSSEKCLKELLAYMKEQIGEGDSIEVYSCWDSEEARPRARSLDLKIDITTFKLAYPFRLEDKQLVTFYVGK